MSKALTSIGNNKTVNLLDIQPEDIDIKMIATSLGRQARWNGNGRGFYSVAEHCVVMSKFVPDNIALACLLHDAHEAFTGDIIRPFKKLIENVVEDVQANIDETVCKVFKVEYSESIKAQVLHADNQMLVREWTHVMANHGCPDGYEKYEPFQFHPMYWPAEMARDMFIKRFVKLTKE